MVPSLNFDVSPVLLDTVTFYSVRDSFLRDENFVFGELIIEDFDDFIATSVIPQFIHLIGTSSSGIAIFLEKFLMHRR